MKDLEIHSQRKMIALRRNLYKRSWPELESELAQKDLDASCSPLSAESSVGVEEGISRLVSVAPSKHIFEMHKVRESQWLELSLGRLLGMIDPPLNVSLSRSKGLIFEASGLTGKDGLALLDFDGDTVVISTRDVTSWVVLDINEDDIEGRFYELNACLDSALT